jgi:hypothetical protein
MRCLRGSQRTTLPASQPHLEVDAGSLTPIKRYSACLRRLVARLRSGKNGLACGNARSLEVVRVSRWTRSAVASVLASGALVLPVGAAVARSALRGLSTPRAVPMGEYVSQEMSPFTRRLLLGQMRQLSPTDKSWIRSAERGRVSVAVINGTDGRIYYNHPEDRGSILRTTATLLDTVGSRSRRAGKAHPFDPGSSTNTGPYRRVYTTGVNAIPTELARVVRGRIIIPATSSSVALPSRATRGPLPPINQWGYRICVSWRLEFAARHARRRRRCGAPVQLRSRRV